MLSSSGPVARHPPIIRSKCSVLLLCVAICATPACGALPLRTRPRAASLRRALAVAEHRPDHEALFQREARNRSMADFQAQPTPLAFSSADRRASRVMPDHAWVAMGFLAVATIVLLLLAVCFQLEKMSSKSQTEEEPEASGILSTRFGLGQHIMHIPETEECHVRENEHLGEDIFAVAISSLSRDSVMII